MKESGVLTVVTLLLLVFVLVEVRPMNAQVERKTLTYTDGSRYEGEIRDGKRHGRGTYTWPSGHQYVGQWYDNKMHGIGTYNWPDGSRYVGEWHDDKMHGRGTMIHADGSRLEGEWREGKRIQAQQQRTPVRGRPSSTSTPPDQSQYIGKNCERYKRNSNCYRSNCYGSNCYKDNCYGDPECEIEAEIEYNACVMKSEKEYNACVMKSEKDYNVCVGERYLECKRANKETP